LLELVVEKLPLVALAATDSWITLRTHTSAGVTASMSERVGNAAVSCVTYLAQFFVPIDLAAFYPTPPGGPNVVKVAAAVGLLATLSAAAVWTRKRYPYFFVGWFWYLGLLAPVLGLITVSVHAMADRYTYLATIGLAIVVGEAGARIAERVPAKRMLTATAGVAAIVLLLAGAARQTSFWHDDASLWSHALECTTDNGKAELWLANALNRQKHYEEAVPHYQRAQALAIDSAPFNDMGAMQAERNLVDEALVLFRRAVEIDPRSARAQANLGGALARTGKFAEAREHFELALELDPENPESHRNLAQLLLYDRQPAAAEREFRRTLELDARDKVALADLGSLLAQQGKLAQAIPLLDAALQIDSTMVATECNLAAALVSLGRLDEAAAHYRHVLRIDPNQTIARQQLAALTSAAGRERRSPTLQPTPPTN
jgi:Tfp pilus assembly protein PilF